MDNTDVKEAPYPAPSKQATGQVGGIETEAQSTFFSDKILVTLSQDGKLSQWIQVPLSAPSPATVDMYLPGAANPLLPMPHLTPRTLLGGGGEERESTGQLCAVQIGSLIARRDPDEKRTLVVGLGLGPTLGSGASAQGGRETFFDVVELVQRVL